MWLGARLPCTLPVKSKEKNCTTDRRHQIDTQDINYAAKKKKKNSLTRNMLFMKGSNFEEILDDELFETFVSYNNPRVFNSSFNASSDRYNVKVSQ